MFTDVGKKIFGCSGANREKSKKVSRICELVRETGELLCEDLIKVFRMFRGDREEECSEAGHEINTFEDQQP